MYDTDDRATYNVGNPFFAKGHHSPNSLVHLKFLQPIIVGNSDNFPSFWGTLT